MRASWASDDLNSSCSKCRNQFSYMTYKHHCRKCGLIFCNECSRSKLLISADELVMRPQEGFMLKVQSTITSDEDSFRSPKRVCDGCSHQLRGLQEDLRILVSRANQETIIDSTTVLAGIPQLDYFLENEIRNATLMLHNLRTTSGEENIPRELLELAKGVVFMTIVKAGFMFTGRYGTGIVVAKLPDGSWSPPSALALTGMGWGLQIGAELTEVLLILSTDSAVDAFKSRAQISIGAELGVSVGPIGRSLASDVSAGNKGAAHAFSYAHSKGLFFGASLEASGIAARPDVNRKFYGQKLSPSVLLSGEHPRPFGAQPLYEALDEILGTRTPYTGNTDYDGSSNNHFNQSQSYNSGRDYNGNIDSDNHNNDPNYSNEISRVTPMG
mmetsp:Transcript_20765/g.20115  ORF Transcript_20765/g.20115 Transcript_20765/m.20115 type:complete len:385 (-) Transcript_20765:26-1180(-)